MRSEPGSADRGRSLVPTGPRFRDRRGKASDPWRGRLVVYGAPLLTALGQPSRVRISLSPQRGRRPVAARGERC